MAEEHQKGTKAQLAFALAQGVTAAKWARNHNVPKMTAYRWEKEPEVREAVQAYRRRTVDQAVGLMTKHTARAAGVIAKIAFEGESDTVRLRAARAIFSEMKLASEYSGLEFRMSELEGQIRREVAARGVIQNPPPTANGGGGARPQAGP
jgi:hypothetical protein